MSTTEPLLSACAGGGAGGNDGEEAGKKSRQSSSKGRRVCIDEALSSYAGEFGRWQLRHFVAVSAAWALEALHTMVIIFADREPPTSCAGGGWEWAGAAAASSSTVAEWGLVCGERYKVGLAQAVFFAGCMIGAGVFGHLSDSFLGRKGSLQVVCILNAAFGLLTAASPNYWAYAALRLLTGFSTGSVGVLAFVLATEPVGPARRGAAGMSTFYFFSGGIAALAGVAALFPRSWRLLYVVTSLPSLVFAVAVVPFVSESPRWYLVRRRPDDALRVIRAIAATNGRAVPEDLTLKLDDEDEDDEEEQGKEGGAGMAKAAAAAASSGSIVDVFRSRTTRVRLVLSVLINLLTSVVYYGLSLNVVNLKTNLYVTVVVNSLAEMPAYLLTALLLDHFGRKPLAIGTILLSGIFCTAGSLIPGAGIMRFNLSAHQRFNSSELFPLTNVHLQTARECVQGGADGVRRGGHLRHGGDVQPAVHLHGGAVPDGGAERGAGVHGAGRADGGHRGAAGGDARREAAIRGVWRLGHRRRPARLLPAGDHEQAPVRHHGRAGGRGEERSQVIETMGRGLSSRWQRLGAQINGLRCSLMFTGSVCTELHRRNLHLRCPVY